MRVTGVRCGGRRVACVALAAFLAAATLAGAQEGDGGTGSEGGGLFRAASELVAPEVWRSGGATGTVYGGAPAHRLRLAGPAAGCAGDLGGVTASRDRTLVPLEGRYRWQADPPLPAVQRAGTRPAADLGPWPDLGGGDPLRLASLPMSFDEFLETAPGRWRVAFSSVYFNLWDGSWHTGAIHREFGLEGKPLAPWELRTLERRHPEDPIYRVDVEGWVARLQVSRGMGAGLTVSLSLPWVTVGRPNWDQISKAFHESLGLHVGDRRIFAPGRTLVYVRGRDRSTAIEGWDDLEGSRMGDTRVMVSGPGWNVGGGAGRWAVALEAPTGEQGTLGGSCGWDLGLRYALTWSRGPSQWRAAAGFSRLDPGGSFLGVRRTDTWHLTAGWRHAFRRGSQVLADVALATSPLADFTDTAPGEPSLTVGLGGRFDLGRDLALTVAVTENMTSAGSAPDVVLGLRLEGAF